MKMMMVSPKDNSGFDDVPVYELKTMIFSFASLNQYDENTRVIEFYFIARMKTDEEIIFKFVFVNDIGENDNQFIRLFNSLSYTSLFNESKNFSEMNKYNAMFITEKIKEEETFLTDFYIINDKCFFGMCMDKYGAKSFVKVLCPTHIQMGINILFRSIAIFNINDSIIIEAQNWLMGEDSRKNAKFETVKNYEIVDISRSTKMRKNQYGGVLVMKFTSIDRFDNDIETTVVMNYVRDRAVSRKISSTIDFLSGIYGTTSYSIMNICGQNIADNNNDGKIQLIAFNKDQSIKVFEVPNALYQNILTQINKI